MTFRLPPFVKKIIKKFEANNFQIYVVGGAVRDLITGIEVADWDFTTNATPEQILKIFPEGFYDNQFGTVGISHKSSTKPYEITTFRIEGKYEDKRRPSTLVWGKTLKQDLSRRDFTINAMALSTSLQIIDPFTGQQDLKNKIIRAVGDPVKRFAEDALRMMRAIRQAAQLGFTIEEKTFSAIKMHAESINLIAKERVKDELFKLLKSPNPYEGVVMLRNSGILNQIIPQLEQTVGVEQKSPGRHHTLDVWNHLLLSLKNCPSKDPLVRLATLLHDIGKPQTRKVLENGTVTFYNHEIIGARIIKEIANRLSLSKKEKDKLWVLVRRHQFTVDERQTDSAIRRFIKNVGKENMQDMLDLRVGDRLGGGATETSWRLEKFKERLDEVQKQPFSVKDLKVNGQDVMEVLGITPGPKVGQILNQLFAEVEEDISRNEREYLLGRIKELDKI